MLVRDIQKAFVRGVMLIRENFEEMLEGYDGDKERGEYHQGVWTIQVRFLFCLLFSFSYLPARLLL
jgi:hypothetical protein